MKYILIKGSQWAGKAETIKEVCKRLKPATIRKVHVLDSGKTILSVVDPAMGISEGNYLITVRSKCILVVSGSPTKQRMRITSIIDAIHKLNLKPDFAIISARKYERLKDFATTKELEKFGKCIHEAVIWRIPAIKFNLTDEWNKRISHLTAITLHNI